MHWSRIRRRAESGRRFVGQGDRHLLAPDECRRHRTRRRPHLVGRGGTCQRRFRRLGSSPLSTPCRAKCFSASSRPGAKPLDPASCTAATMRAAKTIAAELIRDVGFDPVDAGPLRIARYTEPFALLVGSARVRGRRRPRTGVPVRAVWGMRAFLNLNAGISRGTDGGADRDRTGPARSA